MYLQKYLEAKCFLSTDAYSVLWYIPNLSEDAGR